MILTLYWGVSVQIYQGRILLFLMPRAADPDLCLHFLSDVQSVLTIVIQGLCWNVSDPYVKLY